MSNPYQRKFIEQLFDPKFHWIFFKARLKANYERQHLVDAGLVKSAEYWGLHNAMNAVFEHLAQQEPLSPAEIDRLLND
jgi:hypothetical protein